MGAAASLGLPGLGLLLAMLAAWWAGVAVHQRIRQPEAGAAGGESYVLSGAFGLLALLMAFAFSLAIGRYEARRLLVVEEANAVGTMPPGLRCWMKPSAAHLPMRSRAMPEHVLRRG